MKGLKKRTTKARFIQTQMKTTNRHAMWIKTDEPQAASIQNDFRFNERWRWLSL